jgi:hypothetical protein
MLLVLFMVALMRLLAEGEWYLVASLLLGIWSAREDMRRLFREEEKKD